MKTTTTKQTLDCPGAGGSPFTARAKRIATGVLTAAALLSTACGNDDSGGDPYVTISPATAAIAFSAEAAESYTYKVSTNQPVWLPITDQSWCKVEMNPSEGTFTITALPNDKTAAPPPATITVTAGKAAPVTINATQEAAAECDVYVSGSYQTADYNTFACYWKNGVQKTLPVPEGTVDSHCTSIAASGGSIYLSGNMGGTGCYWKDDVRTDLPNSAESGPSQAFDIAVEGTTVYTLGWGYYWRDKTHVEVKTPDFTSRALAVSDGKVHIAGTLHLGFGLLSQYRYLLERRQCEIPNRTRYHEGVRRPLCGLFRRLGLYRRLLLIGGCEVPLLLGRRSVYAADRRAAGDG